MGEDGGEEKIEWYLRTVRDPVASDPLVTGIGQVSLKGRGLVSANENGSCPEGQSPMGEGDGERSSAYRCELTSSLRARKGAYRNAKQLFV
ncbi:hypothetical protein K0M31_007381 [Melipona bicolor]|uniref:Uncharacterized protein n=1 Tax=Melipona bicolor TaxID=60889 RepID=A0AA40GBD4_9HYME|nr:hypothetical protein K0M31_007381 [Melipona bicolor]